MASVRKQGVRSENLLKDGDNLLQRYRNLETREKEQAQVLSALHEDCNNFITQAENTRVWIRTLLEPLSASDIKMKTAQVSEGKLNPITYSL